MALVLDPVYIVNLVLCAVILALDYVGYRKTGNQAVLVIGIAFGLFGISHLATLLGYAKELEAALIAVRTIAYLSVAYALYRSIYNKKRKTGA